ncbi:head maturation protease, ClpP-related [Janthinobacterium sp. GB4P2]|uniref:head maturation protease, ClpP-related n=1 Tax=Janthinobacterium sp. GB4P2 TaxID=3424189 RepID=UPI003F20211D
MSTQTMQPRAAGRVLSAANESSIREARDLIDAVLSKLAQDEPEESAHAGRANRMALKPGRVRVNADATEGAEVMIYGDIGYGWYDEGITGESISREIAAIDADEINVRINSGGGLVFEGLAIYNALARHNAKIIMHVDSIAASIASVILMAGDEIRISEGAQIMIHKPWSGLYGDANALRKEAEILDKLEGGIIDIYAARTDAKRADLETWVGAETWFTGQEAVDAGFADSMTPAKKKVKAASSALFSSFKNAPKALLATTDAPEIREFEIFLRDGEGLSNAQAKRIAAQAARGLDRDDPLTPQVKPLRDVGGESADAAKSEIASRLAKSIAQFTSTI